MRDRDATQLLPVFGWHDPRVHLLDDTWLLTIAAIVLAIALPWFAGGLRIDFAAVAFGLVTVAAIHIGFVALCGQAAGKQRKGTLPLVGLHALGVVTVAFIWVHAGGLQNPLFLTVFALPVIGAIFLSRWQPYFTATLSAVMVALLASTQAPELRWYAPVLSTVADWMSAAVGKASGGVGLPFAGFYAPSEYFVVLLEMFVVMLFACAVAAEYLAVIFDRLHAQASLARAEAVRSQELWSGLLEQIPLPAVLLDPSTYEVICASASARAKFFGGEDSVVGREFFQAMHFSYPEPVQDLVTGTGGVERQSMVRLGDQLVAAEICVQHVAQQGRRFALLMINDTTEALCTKAALDAAEAATLVADSQGRILALNRAAHALFPEAKVGADVSQLVSQFGSGVRWWDPGLSGRRKVHVTVMRRVYQVTTSSVALLGEDRRLYVVAFLPVTQVATAEESATTTIPTVMRWP